MNAGAAVKRIPLPARGGGIRAYAIVDDADFEALTAFRWFLGTDGYARRFERTNGHRRAIGMHRQILGLTPGDGLDTDHINGHRLDNRRSNLRAVTRAQNMQNVRIARGLSGHRHVYWHSLSSCWRVQLRVDGSIIFGGYFKHLEDAVAAAAELRRVHHPFAPVEGVA